MKIESLPSGPYYKHVEFPQEIVDIMNTKFYLVGGAVREKLLGLPVKDFDYSVEAPSYEVMKQAIVDRGGKIFLESPEFLTVRAKVPKLGIADYVLCRKESKYEDGRHPELVEPGTLMDDLARRDFTINAMAQEEGEGPIIDPFNGQYDLEIQCIRAVGNARERFEEDHLRILRAVRFAITKNFFLHFDIVNCLNDLTLVEKLREVSAERVREELLKMFSHSTWTTLKIFSQYEYLNLIFSRFPDLWLKPTLENKK